MKISTSCKKVILAMLLTLYFLLVLVFSKSRGHNEQSDKPEDQIRYPNARRILKGSPASDTRPYMVYLRAADASVGGTQPDPNWLCGGVIIHPLYVLTSAACIEDTSQFYVVAGTYKWLPVSEKNACIRNGALRAVWKCIPKTYTYDGNAPNNIRWMVNDIAVVKLEEPINFEKRVKGCDFIPQMIAYNNLTSDLEKPGTQASIAGWGSTHSFTEATNSARSSVNSDELMEADVYLISKGKCKNFWHPRYHDIITENMICGQTIAIDDMSEACLQNHVACRQLTFGEEHDNDETQGARKSDRQLLRSLARVNRKSEAKRTSHRRVVEEDKVGGFCENDHGGPLVYGHGKTSMVIGIITAYQTMNQSKQCVGPFLYTSVWNNRHLISCAIYKELGTTCRTVLRSQNTILEETTIEWPAHPSVVRVEMDKNDTIHSEGQRPKERQKKKKRVFLRSSKDEVTLGQQQNTTTSQAITTA